MNLRSISTFLAVLITFATSLAAFSAPAFAAIQDNVNNVSANFTGYVLLYNASYDRNQWDSDEFYYNGYPNVNVSFWNKTGMVTSNRTDRNGWFFLNLTPYLETTDAAERINKGTGFLNISSVSNLTFTFPYYNGSGYAAPQQLILPPSNMSITITKMNWTGVGGANGSKTFNFTIFVTPENMLGTKAFNNMTLTSAVIAFRNETGVRGEAVAGAGPGAGTNGGSKSAGFNFTDIVITLPTNLAYKPVVGLVCYSWNQTNAANNSVNDSSISSCRAFRHAASIGGWNTTGTLYTMNTGAWHTSTYSVVLTNTNYSLSVGYSPAVINTTAFAVGFWPGKLLSVPTITATPGLTVRNVSWASAAPNYSVALPFVLPNVTGAGTFLGMFMPSSRYAETVFNDDAFFKAPTRREFFAYNLTLNFTATANGTYLINISVPVPSDLAAGDNWRFKNQTLMPVKWQTFTEFNISGQGRGIRIMMKNPNDFDVFYYNNNATKREFNFSGSMAATDDAAAYANSGGEIGAKYYQGKIVLNVTGFVAGAASNATQVRIQFGLQDRSCMDAAVSGFIANIVAGGAGTNFTNYFFGECFQSKPGPPIFEASPLFVVNQSVSGFNPWAPTALGAPTLGDTEDQSTIEVNLTNILLNYTGNITAEFRYPINVTIWSGRQYYDDFLGSATAGNWSASTNDYSTTVQDASLSDANNVTYRIGGAATLYWLNRTGLNASNRIDSTNAWNATPPGNVSNVWTVVGNSTGTCLGFIGGGTVLPCANLTQSSGCVNMQDFATGTPNRGKNMTMCFGTLGFSLAQPLPGINTSAAYSSWAYNSNVSLRFTVNFNTTLINRTNSTSEPSGHFGVAGTNNTVNLTFSGKAGGMIRLNSTHHLPGINLLGSDELIKRNVQVFINGQNSTNFTFGSLVVNVPNDGVNTISVVYKIPATSAADTTTTTAASTGTGAVVAVSQASVTTTTGQATITLPTLSTGQTATVTITKTEGLPVRGIDITVKAAVASGISVIVQKVATKPAEVTVDVPSAVGKVHSFITVTKAATLKDADVSSAKIRFAVEKSWITANNVDKNKVVLQRFADGKWNALSTTLKSESGDEVNYEATSPGLSVFAITGEVSAVAPGATTTTTTVPGALPGGLDMTTVGLVVLVLVIVALAAYFLTQKKKK